MGRSVLVVKTEALPARPEQHSPGKRFRLAAQTEALPSARNIFMPRPVANATNLKDSKRFVVLGPRKGERFVFAKAADFLTRRFGLGANPVGSASVFEAVERVGEPEKGSASFAVLSWKHCLGPGLGRGKSFKVEALRSWSVPELKRFILRRLF